MISAVNQNNTTNFGQVNLVRVSKKAFKNPENMKACLRDFDIQIDKINGDKIGGTRIGHYINRILYFLTKKYGNSIVHMEGYKGIRTLEKNQEKDYYSFSVFTGADIEKIRNILSKENGKRNGKKIYSEYTFDNYMEQFSSVKRFMSPDDKAMCFKKYMTEMIKKGVEIIFKQTQDAFKESKIHEFRLNNLDELTNIKHELGFEK